MIRFAALVSCALVIASCRGNATNIVLASLDRSEKIDLLCADVELRTGNRDDGRQGGPRVRGDGSVQVHRVATLENAGPGEISFLSNRRDRRQLSSSRASAVILSEEFLDGCSCVALVMDNACRGYARAAALQSGSGGAQ